MRRKVLYIVVILFSLFSCKQTEKNGKQAEKNEVESFFPAIKTARHWTSPVINEDQVEKLAQADILTVDLENMFNNYHHLVKIKQLNPNLKLICYSNPMEIWTINYSSRPWQNKVIEEIINNRQKWLLRNDSGKSLTFWPNMVMLNMSRSCPLIGFERYSAWMARKLNKEVLSDSIWDGYFMDNATPNIAWVAPGTIDINNNGRADEDSRVDMSWKKGVKHFLKIIHRANDDDFIIIGNKGDHSFLDITDGKMFENFPNPWLGDT